MKNFFKKLNNSKLGYTMAEVLIVVAIIAILAAIAVPSVITVQKNYQMLKLDEAARSIFTSAQSRMSELRASGELSDSFGGIKISAQPSDFPESLHWGADGDSKYFALSQGDSSIDALFLPGSLESSFNDGTFYVEYNVKTGMIYSVFFSDESFSYSESLPREKSERKKHSPMLGYYGGSDIDLNDLDSLEAPEFVINNTDELSVNFTSDLLKRNIYDLIISDGENEVIYSDLGDLLAHTLHKNIVNNNGNFTVTLDSLDPEFQFKTLFPELTPGANLTITLSARSSDEGVIPDSTRQTVSSLFASRADDSVVVGYARHLQNLSPDHSAVTDSVTAAEQSGEILWNSSRDFVSISNSALKSFSGNGNNISNLNSALFDNFDDGEISGVRLVNSNIDNTLADVGTLANTAIGSKFDDCRAYAVGGFDASTLRTGGTANTGGLIGSATDCTLDRCSASLNSIRAGSGNTGGLVGNAQNSTITLSYADTGYWDKTGENNDWHKNGGAVNVGIISSSGNAGGLVGSSNGGEIKNSYAAGNIALSSGTASGFVGIVSNNTAFTSCYAAMTYLDTASAVNGFSPSLEAANQSCFYLSSSSVKGNKTGALSFDDLVKCMNSVEGWISSSQSSTHPYGRGNDEAYPFPQLNGLAHYGDWPDGISLSGLYYYEKYDIGNGIFRYGFFAEGIDGATNDTVDTLSNIYTVTEDGYVFLSENAADDDIIEIEYTTNTATPSKLELEAETVKSVADGTDVTGFFIRPVGNNDTKRPQLLSGNASTSNYSYTKISVQGDDYFFIPHFAKTSVNGEDAAPTAFGTAAKPFEIRSSRQLYQLSKATGSASGYRSAWYTQTMDVDFQKYISVYDDMKPISAAYSFTGVYDGGGKIITGTGIDAGNAQGSAQLDATSGYSTSGLFGFLNGALRNIVFISDTDADTARQITGADRAGGLVGTAFSGSTIENCSAAGFDISAFHIAGGLVGYMSGGSIISSSAANAYFGNSADVSTGGSISIAEGTSAVVTYVGGFAGYLNSSNVTISNCYALSSIRSGSNIGAFFYSVLTPTVADSYAVAQQSGSWLSTFTNNSSNSKITGCLAYDGSNGEQIKAFASKTGWELPQEGVPAQPYAPELSGKTYPYPSSLKKDSAPIHFGNWPEEKTVDSGLLYYELYADPSSQSGEIYGYFGEGIDSLRNDLSIKEDGYVFVHFTQNNASSDISIKISQYKTITQKFNQPDTVTIDGRTAKAVYLRPSGTAISLDNSEFISLTSTQLYEITSTRQGEAVTAYFNPNFAKTASSTSRVQTSHEIRTARQLAQLSAITNSYKYEQLSVWSSADMAYSQSCDIDFSTYTAQTAAFNPIAGISGESRMFHSSYNGNGYTVTGLGYVKNVSPTGTGGLFAVIAADGRVSNVVFKSSGSTIVDSGGGGSVGALVGQNNGTVENCTVIGIDITASGSGTGGGFAGVNSGTIKNCVVQGGRIYSSSYSSAMGGFAGKNTGVINNCFVSGADVSALMSAGGFVAENSSGGVISNSAADNSYFTSSAGGGSVTFGNGGSWGGAGAGFAALNSSGSSITNCYAVSRVNNRSAISGNVRSGSASGFCTTNSGSISNSYCVSIDGDSGAYLPFGVTVNGNCYAYDGANLASIELLLSLQGTPWGKLSAEYSHPFDPQLIGQAYPFPAIVKDSGGSLVHYGDWPLNVSIQSILQTSPTSTELNTTTDDTAAESDAAE